MSKQSAETAIIELSLGRLFEYQAMTDSVKDRADFARLLFQQVYTAGLVAGAKAVSNIEGK
jgi:hypothetical protein